MLLKCHLYCPSNQFLKFISPDFEMLVSSLHRRKSVEVTVQSDLISIRNVEGFHIVDWNFRKIKLEQVR